MFSVLTRFAAESGPSVHIAPAGLFTIRGVEITNSILYAWICSFFIIVVLAIVAWRMTLKPKRGLTQFIEIGVDFISVGAITHSAPTADVSLLFDWQESVLAPI